MHRRVLASLGAATTMTLVAMASLPVSGQKQPPRHWSSRRTTAVLRPPTRFPRRRGAIRICRASGAATMPRCRCARPQNLGDRLVPERRGMGRQSRSRSRPASATRENAVGSFRGDFARRAFRQTSLIVDPPDGRTPAFTPEAQKRRAPRDQGTFGNGPFDSTEDFTLYDRCITRGIVGSVMRVIYGNGNRIVQAPGMVAISYEMIHDTRVFYTDGRPHVGQGIRQYLGDSRARWEGDELVVETTNLTDKTSIGAERQRTAPQRQDEDHRALQARGGSDVVQYQITVDDPVTYARPFTMSLPLTPLDGGDAASLRVSRGELRDSAVARRRARRRRQGCGRSQARHHSTAPAGAGWSGCWRTADRRVRTGRTYSRRRSRRGPGKLTQRPTPNFPDPKSVELLRCFGSWKLGVARDQFFMSLP